MEQKAGCLGQVSVKNPENGAVETKDTLKGPICKLDPGSEEFRSDAEQRLKDQGSEEFRSYTQQRL